jgi:hypothetical protein
VHMQKIHFTLLRYFHHFDRQGQCVIRILEKLVPADLDLMKLDVGLPGVQPEWGGS